MKSQLVLAWDTTTPWSAIALIRVAGNDVQVLGDCREKPGSSHSTFLPVKVAEMLNSAEVSPADLDLIAAGQGPGSFTGLRTGLALAKGLAMGAGKPLIGVPTLEILAAELLREEPQKVVAPIVDAWRQEIFAAIYESGNNGDFTPVCLAEPRPMTPEKLPSFLVETAPNRPIIVGGPAISLMRDRLAAHEYDFIIEDPDRPPSAVMLARLALERWQKKQGVNHPLAPMYIREPDIKVPKPILPKKI